MKPALQIHTRDNVAVALATLTPGQTIPLGPLSITLTQEIPAGHKFALTAIAQDEDVMKYGFPIGRATAPIPAGSWVHTHNTRTRLEGELEYTYTPKLPEAVTLDAQRSFDGYRRTDGQVGIRNELWIIPLVGCVNGTAQRLVEMMRAQGLPDGVDGVNAFPHPHGCSQLGQDHANTQKILTGLVHHPNAGGVLVVGLGCENNHADAFRSVLGAVDQQAVKFLVTQEVDDEIEEGLALLNELALNAAAARREPCPLSDLRIGLKCGGSDGFSGITANPLVGAFSDQLIAHGGTTLLTEVPEMFGAEQLLMDRCETRDVFDRCVQMINRFKRYFADHNQPVYENPSPGNKAGGITTLEDKSLGCTQKGGTARIVDVLDYGDRIQKPGLSLLTGPGNDIVACTVQAAAGAQAVIFTTGRGTPLGGPVPTIKMSTNADLTKRKPRWIDVDASVLLDDTTTIAEEAAKLLDYVIELASGRTTTRNEQYNYREIAIFKDGVTL